MDHKLGRSGAPPHAHGVTMHLARRLRRAIAAIMVLVAGHAIAGGPPGSPGEFDLPAGTRPFKSAIQLRYGASKAYTYIFRADIDAGGKRQIAEGWVMQGTLRDRGDE